MLNAATVQIGLYNVSFACAHQLLAVAQEGLQAGASVVKIVTSRRDDNIA